MNFRYLGAFSAALGVVSVAHANDPDCWLRSVGQVQAKSGALADIGKVDSGVKAFNPVTMEPKSLGYFNKATKVDGNSSSFLTSEGYVKYGELCLRSAGVLNNAASGKFLTAGSDPDPGFNLEFKDQIEFYNPSVEFGKSLSWRICLITNYDLSSVNFLSNHSLESMVQLQGSAAVKRTVTDASGQKIDCIDVNIDNGDSLGLRGTLKHLAEYNSQSGTFNPVMFSCTYIKIESLDGLGKFKACSGATYTAVPEPGTLFALAAGVVGFIKRRKSA